MKMRKGQRLLYALVCKSLAKGEPLRRRDYEQIYAKHIRRSSEWAQLLGSVNCRTGKATERIVRRPWTDYETRLAASQWVIRTLGSLVRIGALKVVPMIAENDIE